MPAACGRTVGWLWVVLIFLARRERAFFLAGGVIDVGLLLMCLASRTARVVKTKSKLLNGINRTSVSGRDRHQWLAHRTRHHANPRVHGRLRTARGHHWRIGVELASA